MLRNILAAVAILAATALCAAEPDRGTRDEAVAMAERVVAYYQSHGLDQTAAAISDPANADFHDRDLYALILGFDGAIRAHGTNPKFVGRDMMNLKDQNGVMIAREMIRIAGEGGNAWLDYLFANPATKKVEPKSSYVLRLDDELLVAVGVYRG